MRKTFLLGALLFMLFIPRTLSQQSSDTTIYLITCGSGTETYSIYGHGALRVVIKSNNTDWIYNWGVFDFDAPNFTWKFAKGRLDYMLGIESAKRFFQDYYSERRYVLSQKINLDPSETSKLVSLINENLKPENIKYRYDFFYDDCTTRIRDLLEKSVGKNLLYPPPETGKLPTFRDMVGKYQHSFPWLNFGVDLIMGSPADKEASFRDRMFLPIEMKKELSETVINRSGKMIPLLQNPEVILDFDAPVVKTSFLLTPLFDFTVLMIIVIILSSIVKSMKMNNLIDIIVFSVFSILALLMIFFNFFTDHLQMKWNLNMIWLNPFILLCLASILMKKPGTIWFRIVFFISVLSVILQIILPQSFNMAFFPLDFILLVRSSVRTRYNWNPLSLK
jgi:hypothetical protein